MSASEKICFYTNDNWVFFFQAEDGIRDAQESRGLGDVYKRQVSGDYNPAFPSLYKDGTFDFHGNGQPSIVYRGYILSLIHI